MGVSNLGSGFILVCFHARGQVCLLSERFHTAVITTQWGIPSGPAADFLVLAFELK